MYYSDSSEFLYWLCSYLDFHCRNSQTKLLNKGFNTFFFFFSSHSCFQNNVEIHVAHIQSGLSQMGNLHAFAANNTNRD